ncbi:phosphoribosylformimino-5-aminoimidazole carboxamide ribotide isomerase [Piedraia hortae CBS 480.64]|uniref:1-(5-phosphoribosyl)-5-[(5-phosphoribosylamino)methylideneamino] imidazole-4-carboxamide isomerase n=1 Tax=Piedraia hortae CBS 480.64 TaxID=1314780 RepID=A0A6A7C039_9PEZI|nr:phosphoribosylformimino-5-aminoimidazole carboxamide ribotide isomerase [Piedraia hortae CBS 480.64]
MTRFRPCIDLHSGAVKQIVGGTLSSNTAGLKTNFTSDQPAAHFAQLYRKYGLRGGHVIMLGPGNEAAARDALDAWPGELQVGGGINNNNATQWIAAGAGRVIVTSFLFPAGVFSLQRLLAVFQALGGDPSKLVIDLSCRRVGSGWRVAIDRWQTITEFEVTADSVKLLEPYCSEFLIHAADAEGLQAGIDQDLVSHLARICSIPVTYAGGGRGIQDLELVERLSGGRVDLTIGSALDIFGGSGVTLRQCCDWNTSRNS